MISAPTGATAINVEDKIILYALKVPAFFKSFAVLVSETARNQ